MSNGYRYEIPFGDRLRWARTFANPILRQRLLRWAHDGGPLDADAIIPLLEELERLTELERRAPRQPRYPSALWSDRNAAAERAAPLTPELAARLREWVADDYPTEVDDLIIGLALQLAETEEQLAEERRYYNAALDEAEAVRNHLREQINQLDDVIEHHRERMSLMVESRACGRKPRTP